MCRISSPERSYFNPRAPCGARLTSNRGREEQLHFNPRAPCGARRSIRLSMYAAISISTHAPLAGRDNASAAGNDAADDISTHAPLAGRDKVVSITSDRGRISTHAPLAGRDLTTLRSRSKNCISTHAPLAGRDFHWWSFVSAYYISTHAPLAGRDRIRGDFFPRRTNFNPRAPCGARQGGFPARCKRSDFNPRAPCGARQQKCTNHYAHFCDNRQISDAFAQNAACQGILLLFDAGKPCGFWVRTAQVISAHLCFAL